MSLVVRQQLAKSIKTKQNKAKSLLHQEEEFKDKAKDLNAKRGSVEAEIKELTKHLESLGGAPTKEEIKNA